MKHYTRNEIQQIRLDTADPFWLPDGKTDWSKRILYGIIGVVVGVPLVLLLIAIPCVVIFFVGMVVRDHVVPFLTGSGWEEPGHKIDREVGWKEVKEYPVTKHGVRLGEVNIPGEKSARVTFYLWGLPSDELSDANFDYEIKGEMNAEPDIPLGGNLASLNELALAAANHGCTVVILTQKTAYAVEDETRYAIPPDE